MGVEPTQPRITLTLTLTPTRTQNGAKTPRLIFLKLLFRTADRFFPRDTNSELKFPGNFSLDTPLVLVFLLFLFVSYEDPSKLGNTGVRSLMQRQFNGIGALFLWFC